jgi:chromosome partitioning protein
MAKIFCVANQKGGVGKTTTCVNLAAGLAKIGQRVLLVDLDPQGNATMGSGLDKRKLELSVYDVLLENASVAEARARSEAGGYDVLGANRDLAGAEVELVGLERRERRLKAALAAADADYDLVLIDCPPSLSLLTLNGLCSAHGVLVPMQCEYYALEGLTDLVNTIKQVHGNLNHDLKVIGLLRVMFDPRITLQQQVAEQLKAHFGDKVFDSVIPRNVRLAEAPLRPARRGVRPLQQGRPGLCGLRARDGGAGRQALSGLRRPMSLRPRSAPPTATLARRIEDAGLNASAPPQQAYVDGWLLRLSPGKAKRARCVNALQAGRLPLPDMLARCRAAFASSGLPLIVRITPFTQPPDLDARLAVFGWQRFDETRVMAKVHLDDLPASSASLRRVDAATYAQTVGQLRGSAAEQITAHTERLLGSRIPYQGYLLEDARSATLLACGQIAAEDGLAGLYDVFTPEVQRRRGHARQLCLALLHAAREQGARHAYLQVSDDNGAAIALYESLGFQLAYRYHYRSEQPGVA